MTCPQDRFGPWLPERLYDTAYHDAYSYAQACFRECSQIIEQIRDENHLIDESDESLLWTALTWLDHCVLALHDPDIWKEAWLEGQRRFHAQEDNSRCPE
jgi:hypothetical protein